MCIPGGMSTWEYFLIQRYHMKHIKGSHPPDFCGQDAVALRVAGGNKSGRPAICLRHQTKAFWEDRDGGHDCFVSGRISGKRRYL